MQVEEVKKLNYRWREQNSVNNLIARRYLEGTENLENKELETFTE